MVFTIAHFAFDQNGLGKKSWVNIFLIYPFTWATV